MNKRVGSPGKSVLTGISSITRAPHCGSAPYISSYITVVDRTGRKHLSTPDSACHLLQASGVQRQDRRNLRTARRARDHGGTGAVARRGPVSAVSALGAAVAVFPVPARRQPRLGTSRAAARGVTLPTKRTRTYSATVRANAGPVFKGMCKNFSRSQGHGYIRPAHGGEDIFVHISDIEGEYVPVEGDEVTYKVCLIPPKNVKVQAVEVIITHLKPGTKHETWSGQIISS